MRALPDILCLYRLADIVANKLRLEEEEDYRKQGQEPEQQLSESAEAVRNSSVFQQLGGAVTPPQIQVWVWGAPEYGYAITDWYTSP